MTGAPIPGNGSKVRPPDKGPAWWTSPCLPGKRWQVQVVTVHPRMVRVRAVERIGPAARPRWGVDVGSTFLVKPEQLRTRKGQQWIEGC